MQTVSYNAARMRRTEVNGTVRPTNPGRSQLLLTFYRVIRGRLWIIGLDHDYRWALRHAMPAAAVADIALAPAGPSRLRPVRLCRQCSVCGGRPRLAT